MKLQPQATAELTQLGEMIKDMPVAMGEHDIYPNLFRGAQAPAIPAA